MQLFKGFVCFLKAHDKEVNQCCLNFIIFYQKKFLKKVWVGLTSKKRVESLVILFLLQVKKFGFGFGLDIFQARLG